MGLSLGLLVIAQVARGGRRISARLVGFVGLIPSSTALTVLLLSQGEESRALALSVAGIVVSFVFGFAGQFLTITGSARVRIGVVIASKDPFHQEIRKALYSELDSVASRIIDFGGAVAAPREDLTFFPELLARTLAEQVDYLVVWPPGREAANRSDIREAAARLRRLGGLCLFLEDGPDTPDGGALNHALIRHNAEAGADLLVSEIKRLLAPAPFKLLVLLGPKYSEPAVRINRVFVLEFPEGDGIRHIQLGVWSSSEAVRVLCSLAAENVTCDAILCPNDNIALSVVDALFSRRELKKMRNAKVVGFDGLPRASACIAAQFIKGLAVPRLRPGFRLRKECRVVDIHMDQMNLLNPSRARRRLYD